MTRRPPPTPKGPRHEPRCRTCQHSPDEYLIPTLGRYLRGLRLAGQGLEQDELAAAMAQLVPPVLTNADYVSKVENGERPSKEWLDAALAVLVKPRRTRNRGQVTDASAITLVLFAHEFTTKP